MCVKLEVEENSRSRVPTHALALVGVVSLMACGGTSAVGANPEMPAETTAAPAATHAKQLIAPWTSATRTPSAAPEPSGPGGEVLHTAERMVDDGVVVRGSCYRYIDTIFDEAGYSGWRRRSRVFRNPPRGPYADLDLIEPGDWLWIVNYPDADPVGTHSVLFVEWEDRERGYARVVSYVGGRRDRPGDLVGYDVSRTYSIMRAVESTPGR